MSQIQSVEALEILDSRGNPTIEVEIKLEDGSIGIAGVPSGASTGEYEAHELRDSDPKRYNGKGVQKAVENIHTLKPLLIGKSFLSYQELDQELIRLDGTPNKTKLGANAILGISMAYCKAHAQSQKKEVYEYLGTGNILPKPLMNILNGGEHSTNNVDIQEFMIVPVGAKSMAHSLQIGSEVTQSLKTLLTSKQLSTGVGDEGGFAPNLESNEAALQLIQEAIQEAGYDNHSVKLALDCAASEFYNKKTERYELKGEGKTYTALKLIEYYENLVNKYPIISIEDGMDENDLTGWKQMSQKLGNQIKLVGDDLFVTNPERLENIGINQQIGNSILIKLNQIGTVSETMKAIEIAQKNNMTAIISHRSGETSDSFIADLAVATNSGYIKTGAPVRGERTAKYNRLLKIEKKIGDKGQYDLKNI